MIIVDTSVLIEFFRDRKGPIAKTLNHLIIGDEAAYNGIVLSELLQGSRSKKEFNAIKKAMHVLHYLEFDQNVYELGGKISYILRLNGFKIPITDCIIAAQCLQHRIPLFTTDKHFNQIAQYFPLQLFSFK